MQLPDQTRMELKRINKFFWLKGKKKKNYFLRAVLHLALESILFFEIFYSNKTFYLNTFYQPTTQFSFLITSVYDKHIIKDFSVHGDINTASLTNGIACFMLDTHLTHTFVIQLLMQWIKYGNYKTIQEINSQLLIRLEGFMCTRRN